MALTDFAGFGVRGYRSFGGDLEIFGPQAKIHLVVGQNNVGKSNSLRVASNLLSALRDANGSPQVSAVYPGEFDIPDGWSQGAALTLSIGLRLTEDVQAALRFSNEDVARWLRCDAYTRGYEGVVWIDLDLLPDPQNNRLVAVLSKEQVRAAEEEGTGFTSSLLQQISSSLTGNAGAVDHNLEHILRAWQPWQWIPKSEWVEAVREVTALGDENLRTGQGIISRLARLERPPRSTYIADRAQFEALEGFVRDVLEDELVRIEIPDERNTIHIHSRVGMRTLGDLGTGINELIFIATAASIYKGELICIEEPELHLHPTLQRKLINYLQVHTDNHYLISTHSASMLNADVATISHVEMPEKWSVVSPVITPGDLARVASDLGNRASDLVQSNFVIWVEGPSDRLYLRKWLELLDPELVEGAHYAIMFYGGSLLSNLTVDDEEVEDFINLLNINRHLAVVIDSDRSTQDDDLNDTKKRVIAELDRLGAPSWVTEGYTIENYLPRADLKAAVALLYPTKTYSVPTSQFKSPLGGKFQDSTTKPSKTTVARHLTNQDMDLANYSDHLAQNLSSLSDAIRAANGLGPRTE